MQAVPASSPITEPSARDIIFKVRILYFAGVRDVLGCGEECVVGVRTLAEAIVHVHKRLVAVAGERAVRILDSCAFAVNDAYVADLSTLLGDADEVAVIPPVSGG